MSRSTKVLLDEKAREAILRGVNAVYEPVRRSFGPNGSNALMYRTFNRGPRITNDGVTISEVIEPKNEFESLAANAFKEAAKKTNEKAGDGTTATTVIGGKMINDVFAKIAEQSSSIKSKNAGGGAGVMAIRKEILESAALVVEEIKKVAKPIKTLADLEKIAIVSVEDEELGKIIAGMAWEVGTEGYIDTVEGYKGEVETEIIKGHRFPAKVPAKAFVNNPQRYEMVVQDCPVIITNYSLDNAAQIAAFTEHLNTSKLILVAPSFSENVLTNIIGAIKNGFFIYPVATPSLRTEHYQDLATYCGATFIDKNEGKKLEGIRQPDLGLLERLVVKDTEAKEDACAIGGKGEKNEKVAERLETLKKQILETKEVAQKKLLERRIASMASAVGVIRVGGTSQAESLYKKLKIEDAVYACKAALQEGYVEGAGLCLKKIAGILPESIITPALNAPYEQIQSRGEIKIGKDIIDPAKSIRLAVEHASSVVAHLATVDILIPEEVERSPYDGYHEIAQSLKLMAKFWAKREGLIKENELEMELDMLRAGESMQANDQ